MNRSLTTTVLWRCLTIAVGSFIGSIDCFMRNEQLALGLAAVRLSTCMALGHPNRAEQTRRRDGHEEFSLIASGTRMALLSAEGKAIF